MRLVHNPLAISSSSEQARCKGPDLPARDLDPEYPPELVEREPLVGFVDGRATIGADDHVEAEPDGIGDGLENAHLRRGAGDGQLVRVEILPEHSAGHFLPRGQECERPLY
jgi:hypothetical protein